MNFSIKTWTRLGLTHIIIGTALISCSPGQDSDADGGVVTQSSMMEEGESGEAGHDMATLPLPKRLAFMSGHVQAGLALYRAGEAEMAAPHLLHPVSETHEAERKGLDALGFDAALFEGVSAALEEGRPASEVEDQLQKAEANIAAVAEKAGGNPADIIAYLMDTVIAEYTVGVKEGKVTDPGEYQDAFGFAVVALAMADNLDANSAEKTKQELNILIALWPEAPIPPEDPTPVTQISAQALQVQSALPGK
ncbi:MAG: hypothetical protein ABJO01_06475 [Parasphingorhabdus sp.]|uniref:hypothetical protein n=1 Tax=Parasphingorhabdus sp. TaxID=2709688 RepID=UPI0032971013